MRRLSSLLALVPLLGLGELALHQYFAHRAPDAADYAALAPELLKLKQRGVPVVVAPDWAEPLLRQAAPEAFPLNELARADDQAFTAFLEVSLLGDSAPELAKLPIETQQQLGPFRVARRRNSVAQPTVFDFVTAVEQGRVEVWSEFEAQRSDCTFVEKRTETGGLHGHVAYPARRYECDNGRFVAVTLIDDQDYRARRCILVQPPDSGSVVLRFDAVPASARLVGFIGASYFLERDHGEPQVSLTLRAAEQSLVRHDAVAAQGWARFEAPRPPDSASIEVRLERLTRPSADFCFALEAR